jgi:uroporphyrinogen-III synthase
MASAGGGRAEPLRAPLAGRRIVVTRPREQGGDLVHALQALGADVVRAPTIRIEPLADLEPLRRALSHLAEYRWTVFTSQNSVQVVFEHLPTWGISARDFAKTRIAAIGPATADSLTSRGVRVELVPDGFVAESLVAAIASQGELRGARILIPRAEAARDALPEGLRAVGAVVDVIPVYRTVAALAGPDSAALAAELLAGRIDVVTFTSSSTVHHFVQAVGAGTARSGRFGAAVIGPVTAATARHYGLPVRIEAAEFTTAGLVKALVGYFGREAGGGKREA